MPLTGHRRRNRRFGQLPGAATPASRKSRRSPYIAAIHHSIDSGVGPLACHQVTLKVLNTTEDEREQRALVRFVDQFCSLPTRSPGQPTSEFFALVDEALRTGEIDSRLRVITSPRFPRPR